MVFKYGAPDVKDCHLVDLGVLAVVVMVGSVVQAGHVRAVQSHLRGTLRRESLQRYQRDVKVTAKGERDIRESSERYQRDVRETSERHRERHQRERHQKRETSEEGDVRETSEERDIRRERHQKREKSERET
jgi:hypothetical protein